MTPVPNTVFINYETTLKKRSVKINCYADYKKWLRYYLDFSAKYPLPDSKSERVRLFSEKLREKKQSEKQRQQAIHAVFLYFEMEHKGAEPIEQQCHDTSPLLTPHQSIFTQRKSQYCEAGYQVKSASPEWDALLEIMAGEIKVRHYSRRTLKTYANWFRRLSGLGANRLQILLAGPYSAASLVNRTTIDLRNRQNLSSPSRIFASIS